MIMRDYLEGRVCARNLLVRRSFRARGIILEKARCFADTCSKSIVSQIFYAFVTFFLFDWSKLAEKYLLDIEKG
jgi:hypothetical protein